MMGWIMGEGMVWLGAGLAAAAAFLVAWLSGGKAARDAAEIDRLRKDAATRKRIEDVKDIGDDPAVLRDWLRERASK